MSTGPRIFIEAGNPLKAGTENVLTKKYFNCKLSPAEVNLSFLFFVLFTYLFYFLIYLSFYSILERFTRNFSFKGDQ